MSGFYRISQLTYLFQFLTYFAFAQGYGGEGSPAGHGSFSWPKDKKAAISLTFDDARLSQIDKGIPLLNSYNIKATFYVLHENFIRRIEGWKKAIIEGHEIGNHSLLHPCTGNFIWSRQKALERYTLLKMGRELDSASRVIEKMLGVKPVSFAYPCGQTFVGEGLETRSYVPLIAARFETGRTWMNEGPNDPEYCDLAQLTGIELDGKTFSEIKPLIDSAKAHGNWLVFAGHEMNDDGVQTTLLSTLDSLCRYALNPENEIWIDNVKNISRYVREKREMPVHGSMSPYQDPSLPVEQRIDDLISRMTLPEKIGQLNMPCVYFSELGKNPEEKLAGCRRFAEGTFMDGIGPGGGFFTLANETLFEGPEQQARYFNELQKLSLEKTRLKIPLLQTEEGTHGVMCSGATIFPEGLALGSSWNLDLIKNIFESVAAEARAVGIHQLFTLVIEPNRDPRLGRNQEGYGGEDPYLCAQIAKTIVRAVQGDDISVNNKVIAGLCHYPGQSQPVSGLERGAMDISERTLREVFLPPWEAGIKDAGALGVMATYPTIDGIPNHSSYKNLTQMLRGELGFQGLVLSEGSGVNTLVYTGMAKNIKDAAAIAANAGMDVSISFGQGYFNDMTENVNEGKVSMETIDRSVRRVLRIKYELGLFENPFVDPAGAKAISHNKAHQELALQAAREGIVLLKNENYLLPLNKKLKSVAVIGPNANDEKNQLGDYTSLVVLQDIITVLDGIKAKLPGSSKINYVKGCNVKGEDVDEIARAVKAAKKSEVAIVVLGENEWRKKNKQGTDGEAFDAATLELTGRQKELVQKVYATGTPTVVVLINGRPLATRWIAANIPAIVEAWIPGEKGGAAIADVLFGDYNPGGKLNVTIPRHAGQLPVYYNYKPSKAYWLTEAWGKPYVDLNPEPLFEFGFGLSYSYFEYSNLTVEPAVTSSHGKIKISADIKNVSGKAGNEIVQLYIRDKISTVVRPVKELKGFEKIKLRPGEKKTVTFELGYDELKMLDRELNWVVEPGEFKVMVGSSSKDIRLKGNFTIE